MFIDFFINIFNENKKRNAVIWKNKKYSYDWLIERIEYWKEEINKSGVYKGAVVALEADFSANAIALLFALVQEQAIIVPINNSTETKKAKTYDLAQVEYSFIANYNDDITFVVNHQYPSNNLYNILKERQVPGLVMLTSGTSGEPKVAVHDFSRLLEKFKQKKVTLTTLNFLLFDHWGGLNTMFHTLSNGGTVITVRDRSPDAVCELIEMYSIELLPSSPSFLNMLIMSEAYQRHDMSSLKIISYGSEPMPQSTLNKMNSVFPKIKLQQTYGLIEIGVLRSMSKSNDSLWVKLGGEGIETRIIEGILQIKAESAMLGYLNAPSPYTEDGWFNTGDEVEVDGDYIRIIGRKKEFINVGGQKVHPSEIESVLLEMDGVIDVLVVGEANSILGQIVKAQIALTNDEDVNLLKIRVRNYCKEKLDPFKVPVKVEIVKHSLLSDRFKRTRCNN
jgi:long-chain acyl-CoA synthetase